MTLEHLSSMLFYISQKVATPTLHSMIRAAAFLTTDLAISPITSSIQKAITLGTGNPDSSTPPSHQEELRIITEKLDSTINQWSSQQENMKKTLKKVSQIDDSTNLLLMDIWIQSILENVSNIQKAIEDMKTQAATRPANQGPLPHPHTYCDAAVSEKCPNTSTSRESSGLDQGRGCSTIKQRQILIDPDNDHPIIKPDTSMDELAGIF